MLSYFRHSNLQVERKVQGEPVTIADREAEALIAAGLSEGFPADGLLAEETADKDSWYRRERAWVVDPMDGTKDFIAGREGFSVMIGLLAHHRPVLGVVYQPCTGRLYRAALGLGAELLLTHTGQRQTLRPSTRVPPAPLRLVASYSNRSARIDRFKQTLNIQDELRTGSVGVKVGLIAAGERDVYLNPDGHCKLWDTCAPEAILREAGGTMTDLHGAPLVYDDAARLQLDRGIVASNGACHEALIAGLAEAH